MKISFYTKWFVLNKKERYYLWFMKMLREKYYYISKIKGRDLTLKELLDIYK